MEILLLVSVIGSFVAQVFLTRSLLAQLSSKLTALNDRTIRLETLLRNVCNRLDQPRVNVSKKPLIFEKNTITDDEDQSTIEFSEHNPLDLPSDVKFEIEGGDTAIPSGYSGTN